MRTGVNHIDKPDFLTAYLTARTESMSIDTVRNGFAATGLVLYDPDRVLLRLNTQLWTPTPPPLNSLTQQAPWVPETPHNILELKLQTKALKDYIQRRTASPPSTTDLILNQLVKACQMAMHSAVLLAEENKQLWTENRRQKKKRQRSRTYIATGGVLTVQEGLDRSQILNIEPREEVADQSSEPRIRAPRMCSVCRSL